MTAPDFASQPTAAQPAPVPGAPAPAPAASAGSAGVGAAALDDAALVARIRIGDEAACGALFRAYHGRLWKFAWGYVRSREGAEEIVQEIFLALWRDRRELDVRGSPRAWLYAAVRNQALNRLRHERVVARLVTPTADAVAAAPATGEGIAMGEAPLDAQAALEAEELNEAVARAIAALPERRRLAMTLRWKHDLSASEIARVLSTTPESVRVLLCRARQDLASLLARLRRRDD